MVYVVSVTHHWPDGQSFQVTVQVEAADPVAAAEAAVEGVRQQLAARGLVPAPPAEPPPVE